MKNNKIVDERVIFESNKIYKYCFYILCGGILIDLMLKINLWIFGSSDYNLPFFVVIGLEAIFVIVAFLSNVFLLAKKGILFGIGDLGNESFPKKKYALLSTYLSLGIAIASFCLRFFFYESEYGFFWSFLFIFILGLILMLLSFIVFYLIFYLAFRVARKTRDKQTLEIE